ncbi:E3 ubiquitin-protein ligase znrf2 isoform X2 [Centropristis striata]|uniref:E3 ubiquitin-protein ligase znrf2 isoform X2 n=1 Tax=Centropristis striata TaxID=184440 RepID=UPI0027DEF8AB|nr:E3 ubiquitin-protein ligase znrf2 isoform X2 [Centropristis striata]
MGAKQSSPSANPAANGRTRAYSGSDLPSSTSSSSGSNVSRTTAGGVRYHASGASSSQHLGARARSVGGSGGSGARPQSGINIPNSSGAYSSQESGGSSPEEADRGHDGPRLLIGSLPAHLSPHLFGEDVLTKDAGECAICLEELVQGDTIARLPCLCLYHKGCIDEWFEVNRSCPEHPSD